MLIGIFDSLGAQTDRLRCEVCQNLMLLARGFYLLQHVSPILCAMVKARKMLLQPAPLVYLSPMNTGLLRHAVATALTVYGMRRRVRDSRGARRR